jgi:hypothetical protein
MTPNILIPLQNIMPYNFFSDVIGVISHIGPHDFASPTSQRKL